MKEISGLGTDTGAYVVISQCTPCRPVAYLNIEAAIKNMKLDYCEVDIRTAL